MIGLGTRRLSGDRPAHPRAPRSMATPTCDRSVTVFGPRTRVACDNTDGRSGKEGEHVQETHAAPLVALVYGDPFPGHDRVLVGVTRGECAVAERATLPDYQPGRCPPGCLQLDLQLLAGLQLLARPDAGSRLAKVRRRARPAEPRSAPGQRGDSVDARSHLVPSCTSTYHAFDSRPDSPYACMSKHVHALVCGGRGRGTFW